MVGYHLMDIPILVALGLGMTDEYDQTWFAHDDKWLVGSGFQAAVRDEVTGAVNVWRSRRSAIKTALYSVVVYG